jgi:hypothetical protein
MVKSMQYKKRLNLFFVFIFLTATEILFVSEAWSFCTVIDSPQTADNSLCNDRELYARNTCSNPVTANIEQCSLFNIVDRSCTTNEISLSSKQETYLGCEKSSSGVSISYRVVSEK